MAGYPYVRQKQKQSISWHGEFFKLAKMKNSVIQCIKTKHWQKNTVPQKSEGTVDNFSNYWAPHFTERHHSTDLMT